MVRTKLAPRLVVLAVVAGCHAAAQTGESASSSGSGSGVVGSSGDSDDSGGPSGSNTAASSGPTTADTTTAGDDATGGAQACGVSDDPFGVEALSADIEFLASDDLGGRAPDTAGDETTLAFIEDRFACLGLTPAGDDGYRQPFVTSDGRETANVVAILGAGDPGPDPEWIVVGAHHDHLGTEGGEIYNGANDNGSGVATVLAIARSLATSGGVTRRNIAFVTFGFEEHDGECEGSEYFAAHPPAAIPLDRIVYMVDLDMLGTYPSEGTLTTYGTFEGTPGRDVVEARLGATGLDALLGETPDEDDSDFQAFCNVGIPYVYFETWDLECYHAPCDDAERIDYATLPTIAELSADVVADLADSDQDLMAVRGSDASGCG